MFLLSYVFLFAALSAPLMAIKKNVFLIVADDLRPQLNSWAGSKAFPDPTNPKMYTPHTDALAARSLVLKRAYCQYALCNPSRTSFLTGRRPDTTHVYDLITYWRKVGGNYTTIPQYFKEHGYLTAGMGKVFHPGVLASDNDDPMSWTEPYFQTDFNGNNSNTWNSVPKEVWEKTPLEDMKLATHAIETLQKAAPKALSGDKPFFIAVGFHRPHLPFSVPDKYFEHYPLEEVRLPLNPHAPSGMPQIAWSMFDELRPYKDIKFKYGYGCINTTFPDEQVRNMRRAYFAAVTYVDDLVGQVIAEVDRLGLRSSTIVAFLGDHGWQLGEHGEWAKHTNFELATHAPMMVHIPGLTDKGIMASGLTEFVDLFPSLVEAAGLPQIPLCPEEGSPEVKTCTEGLSFLPLVKNESMPWKKAAFSQYARFVAGPYMGYTIRTDQYRYTEWPRFHFYPEFQAHWKLQYMGHESHELYDHYVDPQENTNVAHRQEYADVVEELQRMLKAGWRKAMPDFRDSFHKQIMSS